MDVYAWLLIVVLVIGVLGTFVPMVPGIGLIFAGLLVYGIFDQWEAYSMWFIVVVGIIALASSFLDYIGTMVGAKKFGASNMAAVGALGGGVLGGVLLNIPGTILGGILGAVGAEFYRQRSMPHAMKAAAGSMIGTAVASSIQMVLALIIVLYAIFRVWGTF